MKQMPIDSRSREIYSKAVMKSKLSMTSSRSLLMALVLSTLGIGLVGCNNMVEVPAPATKPIHKTVVDAALKSEPNDANSSTVTKCPPFNYDEQMMCTMQFDPVCVTEKTANGVRQRTAGNACSACNTPEAISYTPGQCR